MANNNNEITAAIENIRQAGLLKTGSFIGGKWRNADADDNQTFPVFDPATRETICLVADHGEQEADDAVDAANQAFFQWKNTTVRQRSTILEKWHDLITENTQPLSELLSLENGKPLAESKAEIGYGNAYIKWYAEEAKRIEGAIIPSKASGGHSLITKEPVGVVAAITPWNFPNAMVARKTAPALAAGCTVVLKPADETPLSALALAELADRAGVPVGVFNVVTGKNAPAIGKSLTSNDAVKKISFTGSTAVGKLLLAQCANSVKKASMELGGNAPFIVFDDADIDRAVDGLIACKFRNAGQVCIAANRVLVQRDAYEAFANTLTQRIGAFKPGHALNNCTLGPLINEDAMRKVTTLVDDAVKDGAVIACGGKTPTDMPNHYLPTILKNVSTDMAIAKNEIFGPVAPLIPFETEDEAVSSANDTQYGLAAYFYTSDAERMWRVKDALHSGMVGVNTGVLANEAAPFGGVKESGIGREGGHEGLDEYLESKYAIVCP